MFSLKGIKMEKSYNNLVYALAKKAKELANLKMNELRERAGYNCDTPSEARREHAHESRGEIIEIILTEEFVEEFDKEFQE